MRLRIITSIFFAAPRFPAQGVRSSQDRGGLSPSCRLLAAALIVFAGWTLVPRAASADGTLTLELPPSQAALQARAAARAKAEASRPPRSVIPARYRTPRSSPYSYTNYMRGQYPARGAENRNSVVGLLGQIARQTPIYRGRSSRTGLLTYAPAGTYVAVQDMAGAWYGVLMADGSMGWLRRSSLNLLNYQVTRAAVTVSPNYAAPSSNATGSSVPTGSDPGDIYPRSTAPYFTGDPNALLQEAYRYLGVPYVWGGNTARGIDCSGFIRNVFVACGFPLPRLGSDQMAYGVPVPVDQLRAGDRLYFGRRKERVGVTHTGLYIGNGYFIHSATSTHGVAISRLDDPRFWRIYVCARR